MTFAPNMINCSILSLLIGFIKISSSTNFLSMVPDPPQPLPNTQPFVPPPVVDLANANKIEKSYEDGMEKAQMNGDESNRKKEFGSSKKSKLRGRKLAITDNRKYSRASDPEERYNENKEVYKCDGCCTKILAFFVALLTWTFFLPATISPGSCYIRNNGFLDPLPYNCSSDSSGTLKCIATKKYFYVDANNTALTLECELDGDADHLELVGTQFVNKCDKNFPETQEICEATFKVNNVSALPKTLPPFRNKKALPPSSIQPNNTN